MKTLIILIAISLAQFPQAQNQNLLSASASGEHLPALSAKDTTEFVPLFLFADQIPQYPGGEKAMIRFFRENIKYPELAYSHGHEGTVLVEFIVEKDGSIKRARVLKGIGLGCDKAALEVLEKMPNWKPALDKGKATSVRYITQIRFSLF